MRFNDESRIQIIKQQRYTEAFDHITGMGWWLDNNLTDDSQRKLFLYEEFFKYYNLLTITGITGLKFNKEIYITQLKSQLDSELSKVNRGIYEVEEQ